MILLNACQTGSLMNSRKYAYLNKVSAHSHDIQIASNVIDDDAITDIKILKTEKNSVEAVSELCSTPEKESTEEVEMNSVVSSKQCASSGSFQKTRNSIPQVVKNAGRFVSGSVSTPLVDGQTVLIWILIIILIAAVLSLLRIDIIAILLAILFILLILILLGYLGVNF